jgi:hypothetical protein
MWDFQTIAVGAILVVAVIVGVLRAVEGIKEGFKNPESVQPKPKRYVMRGYGGGKNATSVHPRQAKRGMRIVYIPGVGYRHVRAGKKQR